MLKSLWQQFDLLVVQDGVLYSLFYNPSGLANHTQLILPSELKVPFLELIHAHDAGHLKYQKCVPHLSRRAWWLTWKRDLKLFIKCCPRCEAFLEANPRARQVEYNADWWTWRTVGNRFDWASPDRQRLQVHVHGHLLFRQVRGLYSHSQ